MAPVGDSAGVMEVSTPVGAARGMARLGAGDIIARDIGAVIMVGIMDIIITIIIVLAIIHLVIMAVLQPVATGVMLLLEEILPVAIVREVVVLPEPDHHPCDLQVHQDRPVLRLHL